MLRRRGATRVTPLIRLTRLLLVLAALLLPLTLFAAAPSNPDTETKGPPSLKGQLLIAAPGMSDPRFRQTVLVMLRHDQQGAMGLVINRPLGEQPIARLLEVIGEKTEGVTGSVPIFLGGPVQPELVFVLHGADYRRSGTLDIDGRVALTATPEIVRDIAADTGPRQRLIVLGYAGWAPGQLEGELAQNAWFTAPIDPKLVFDEDRAKVWELAIARRTRDL
jgi:putative transcriptional regulator